MRGAGSSCFWRVKSSTHPKYHLQQPPPGGAAPHHFQPPDPRESTPGLTLHNKTLIDGVTEKEGNSCCFFCAALILALINT